MNKLGFAINYASQGLTTALVCNKGPWANKVIDIREYLKLFSGLANIEHGSQIATGNFVTFLSFDNSGCFLTQMKAINGRIGDFLAGWIYIPNNIDATGEDITNACNYVQNILSQSNINALKADIEAFFSREYPVKEFTAQYVASRGQVYGVRFLGHYTLKEIVGEHRYQPYYSDYKAVFLLNKDDRVTITKEAANSFRNLTDKDIIRTAILIPPTAEILQKLGRGASIKTADGSDFNNPLLVNVGSKVPFVLSRPGFENMKFEFNVSAEKQTLDLSRVKVTWMKKISPSMFTVYNGKHEKIGKGVRITINGKDVSYQDVLMSEDDCREATVKITVPDYETFEQKKISRFR